MTDQIPADKVRAILDGWERIKEHADWDDIDNLVQDVRALLPTPPRPTLAPSPALPDGWRLADHKDHGRVIVTNPNQESDGYSYCIFSSDMDSTGFDWHPYDPEALTYIDQEADTADAVPPNTLAVGSVWDDTDALARACEETGRDHIAVTDRNGGVSVWDARRDDWRGHYRAVPKYAPYTIIHTGQEDDQ